MGHRKGSMDFRLSGEIVAVLNEMADYNDTSLTEELRAAISDRKFFSEKVAEGHEIFIYDMENNTRVLVDYK